MEVKDTIELRDQGCEYCKDGAIKYSYDDEDGMIMCVHDDPPNKNGFKSAAWWMTVNFRGEQRDFYTNFCPFCGRRLTEFNPNDYIGDCNG